MQAFVDTYIFEGQNHIVNSVPDSGRRKSMAAVLAISFVLFFRFFFSNFGTTEILKADFLQCVSYKIYCCLSLRSCEKFFLNRR